MPYQVATNFRSCLSRCSRPSGTYYHSYYHFNGHNPIRRCNLSTIVDKGNITTKPNLVMRVLEKFYSPLAVKCTTAVFTCFGIYIAEEIQHIEDPKSEIPMSRRLFVDACGAFMFGSFGFYLHLFLPALLTIFPLLSLLPDPEYEYDSTVEDSNSIVDASSDSTDEKD